MSIAYLAMTIFITALYLFLEFLKSWKSCCKWPQRLWQLRWLTQLCWLHWLKWQRSTTTITALTAMSVTTACFFYQKWGKRMKHAPHKQKTFFPLRICAKIMSEKLSRLRRKLFYSFVINLLPWISLFILGFASQNYQSVFDLEKWETKIDRT